MTSRNFPELIEHQGRRYGAKELEFEQVETLPRRTRACLELAVGGTAPPRSRWSSLSWSVIDSHDVSTTMDDYRAYIERSKAEFSVAKNAYVATRSGWFSCRTVCYLAAGLPAVIQDTGYSRMFPAARAWLALSASTKPLGNRAGRSRLSPAPARRARARRSALRPGRVLAEMLERSALGEAMDLNEITGNWDYSTLPANVTLGARCFIERKESFKRFRSTRHPGLSLDPA